MKIIVGTVIKKNEKLLMVQEAQKKCYGQWNFPAGHLDENESIFEGAIRETKEETGYDVKLTGILSIQNFINKEGIQIIRITFNAEIISGEICFDKSEILDVKWILVKELKQMKDIEIRSAEAIRDIVEDLENGRNYSLDMIKNMI